MSDPEGLPEAVRNELKERCESGGECERMEWFDWCDSCLGIHVAHAEFGTPS